jgi:hypothetical protein
MTADIQRLESMSRAKTSLLEMLKLKASTVRIPRHFPGAEGCIEMGTSCHTLLHGRLWTILGALLTIPQFRGVRTPEQYANWIRFKMEVLMHFHKRFETNLLVGGQIDVITKFQEDAHHSSTGRANSRAPVT